MGSDAVKDLREWQRSHASAQERALRRAVRAQQRLAKLDEQRNALVTELTDALDALHDTGIGRDRAAALLGVTPASLPQRPATRRKAAGGTPDAQTAATTPKPASA